jgi:nitronate monooxygenase
MAGQNPLLARLGIQYPILLAPMAGGPSCPELAAAVSNTGGLGSLGAAYQGPVRIAEDLRRMRALTDKPFNVNLFALDYGRQPALDPEPMLAVMREIYARFGLAPPQAPPPASDPFPAEIEAVLEAPPAVFSFTFGIPPANIIGRLKERGIFILGTATTVLEGRRLFEAGADAIVAQGVEAGAHRGTFAGSFENSMVPTLDLVRALVSAVPLPIIASGGLMDGRDIVRAMEAGASATQLGTAFLACPESGASPVYKHAILNAREDTTVVTRAFSGRPARGLANEFIARLSGMEDRILPYPLQNTLTRPMRAAAAQRGDSGYLSLWAGQGVTRARALRAADLVRTLVDEMNAAVSRTGS